MPRRVDWGRSSRQVLPLLLSFAGVLAWNTAAGNPPYAAKSFVLTYSPPSSVTLTWAPPFGPIPTGYHIYRDHELMATTPPEGPLTWSDTLPGYGFYAYAVRPFNADGDSDIRIHRSVQWLDPDGQSDSLRQWGITWRFDKPYEFGRFANGDIWVKGPVKIVSIDPPCQVVTDTVEGETVTRTIHGAMLDPSFLHSDTPNKQGYDSSQRNYDAALNVAQGISVSTPLTISGDHSLVSALSNFPQGTTHPYQTRIRTAAVLTVLAAAPPPGSFRPPYAGPDKTIRHNISELDYSALLKLAAPAKVTVDLDDAASRIERVFLDNNGSDFNLEQRIFPEENMAGYGREVSTDVGDTALMLNLDFADARKEKLLTHFVQMGLDLFGVTQYGAGADAWHGWGGHFTGRKLPVLFAGIVLHDDAMKNVKASFAEDTLTYYHNDPNLQDAARGRYSWTGAKALYKFNYHWTDPKYTQIYEHKHPSTWTKEGDTVPYISDELSERYRYCCSAFSWVGIALSVRLMGAMATWNNPSFFDYMDRWMYEDMTPFLPILNAATGGSTVASDYRRASSILSREMWATYRNISDTEPPTTPQNLLVTGPDGARQLTWDRCGDNVGGVGYRIYRDGVEIGKAYETAYTDATSLPGQTPNYGVAAFDWAGNTSGIRHADTTPPAAPTNLTVQ